MAKYKTPGIYEEEISQFPPVITSINSAVPAFAGYTANTSTNSNSLQFTAIKIHSLIEFEQTFGLSSSFHIADITSMSVRQFYLYDALKLYFTNQGAPCFIVSIGTFDDFEDNSSRFIQGLDILDSLDEPIIYLFPDAVLLNDEQFGKVQQHALNRCGVLRNRFSILDVKLNLDSSYPMREIQNFKNNVGTLYLRYGAAYTPWLRVTTKDKVTCRSINGIFDALLSNPKIILEKRVENIRIRQHIFDYKMILDDLLTIKSDERIHRIENFFNNELDNHANRTSTYSTAAVLKDILNYKFSTVKVQKIWNDNVVSVVQLWHTEYAKELSKAISRSSRNVRRNYLHRSKYIYILQQFITLYTFMDNLLKEDINRYEEILKENIPSYSLLLNKLKEKNGVIPPSGAMAGLYCKIDNERGVWKSPANISISGIDSVSQLYSNSHLADLNIDPVTGKSINVIRPITGYGILVMGTRTLAGNDSEWRYIPICRLLIYIEDCIRRGTIWALQEEHNEALWLKIRIQIENFLIELWKNGAIVGAKPEHAFHVNCGLNSTMTPQDILDGKLIIKLLVAPLRPAEFTVLRIVMQMNPVLM